MASRFVRRGGSFVTLLYVVRESAALSLGTANLNQLGRRAALHGPSRTSRMGLFDAFTAGRSAAPSDPAVYASVVDAAPSWDELRELSGKAGGMRFRETWDAQAAGRGPANHQASLRLFDAPEGTEPRVELYRDTAAWCPYW